MEYLDTSECVSIAWMFNRCRKLKNIDLSNFNTSKVSSMNGMFVCCKSLTTLDLSSFDTSNVVYERDTLESIAEGVKDAKFGDHDFMYTVQTQDDYRLYYKVCNELDGNSIFVV